MNMTLNLTYEDGMKVVEAMKKVAIEYGWAAEELDESGVIAEYSSVVDAALTAMGINVSIDANPSCEDEEVDIDFDDDDDDDDDDDWDEDVDEFGVPADYWSPFDENDKNDEDEEENKDENVAYSLTVKGEFVLRCMKAGYTFEHACAIADVLFGDGE